MEFHTCTCMCVFAFLCVCVKCFCKKKKKSETNIDRLLTFFTLGAGFFVVAYSDFTVLRSPTPRCNTSTTCIVTFLCLHPFKWGCGLIESDFYILPLSLQSFTHCPAPFFKTVPQCHNQLLHWRGTSYFCASVCCKICEVRVLRLWNHDIALKHR